MFRLYKSYHQANVEHSLNTYKVYMYMWAHKNVRELITVKVLHTSLLNTTVVAFKVLPL
jgi:hypothetical protein